MPDPLLKETEQMRKGNKRCSSLVIPVYNERDSLPDLMDEIVLVMRELREDFEIIAVDDCSDDGSAGILEQLRQRYPEHIQIFHLRSRCGQTRALQVGWKAAKGDVVITLDADLQNDPRDIPRLIKKFDEGFDVVCGWRRRRQDKFLKTFFSKSANALQKILSGLAIHDISCTLRVYRKEIFQKLEDLQAGDHRFLPLFLDRRGCRLVEVEVNHRKRQFGASKYTHKRILKVVLDFIKIIRSPKTGT